MSLAEPLHSMYSAYHYFPYQRPSTGSPGHQHSNPSPFCAMTGGGPGCGAANPIQHHPGMTTGMNFVHNPIGCSDPSIKVSGA